MATRDTDRSKLFGRRAALLAGGKVMLLSALAGRMYYLQVMEAERYKMLSDENRISSRLLPPLRGRILDRFGEQLAINHQNFRVVVVAEMTRNLGATLDALSNIIPIGEHERARIVREVRRKRSFVPVTVKDNLSWDDVARVELNAPDLPGVLIDVGQTRLYPQGERVAHVLGYVAAVAENELDGDPLLELPGFRIGKAGIERIHDLSLRGRGGTSQVEVNAVGRVIRELNRNEGQPGNDVQLTLDVALQEFAIQRMGEQSAACVVMDIHSGEVIVMASTPSYDPNAFNQGLTGEQWRQLTTHARTPLINKCVAGQYAPGSTFKMMVAAAALESGLISPDFRAFCNGWVELGNARFHCWKKQGHGAVDLHRGIMHSCDVYFYEVAKRIGIDRIAEMAKRFGLGSPTGLDLPNEKQGLIPTREWKVANFGAPWAHGETLVAGIGQGYVLTTPLQLAVMTARIANGGVAVRPRLTHATYLGNRLVATPPSTYPAINISKTTLALIRKGMRSVVNEPGGTAFSQRLPHPVWQMSGKTGTSQVRRITRAERDAGVKKNDELPWKERDHALFVAYAPEDEPRYSIAVIVEHGGGGSAVAAPIAKDIMMEVLKRDPVSPDAATRLANNQAERNGG